MRGAVPGLGTHAPVADALPGMLLDDDFARRLTSALDEVAAPLLSTVDNYPAYLDPWTAPADVVRWLGTWVAADLRDEWPEDRRRRAVADAVATHGSRGTAAGLSDAVELAIGVRPAIDDPGWCRWTAATGVDPADPLTSSTDCGAVVVRLPVLADDGDVVAVRELIRTAVPAGVPVRLELEEQQ
jgi:phage tail-like protein